MPSIRATSDDTGDIIYPAAVPFVLIHIACLAAIWTGITRQSIVICALLYWLRMFAISAGYHRYFSHRAYATSRVFQFVLAVLSQTSAQKSVLWWAAKHRHHHLHSDTEHDVHSPRQRSFLYSHLGWIFARKHNGTEIAKVADLACYPELMWLHKYELVPAVVVALLCLATGGWAGLVVGFFWSTVILYHATFCINSLAHVHGRARYITGDDSRNNWLLALVTMGEGWHNNHHAYQSSVRQGFRWWEIDLAYYCLKALSSLRLVWKLKTPPAALFRNEQRLGSRVIRRVATQLAASYNPERIAGAMQSTVGASTLAALRDGIAGTQQRAENALASVHLPQMPTKDEMMSRATAMFANTPSLDEIVHRAHVLILEFVSARLCCRPRAGDAREGNGTYLSQ